MMLAESASRFLQGFGDLHHGRRNTAFYRQKSIGDAHRIGVDEAIAEQHLAGLELVRHRRAGYFLVALDDPRVGTDHLVVKRIGVVPAQQGARRDRQVGRDAVAVDFYQLHDGVDVLGQVLVVGLIGNIEGHMVGGGNRNRPQQQQGREHPVEDFAEQGIRVLEIDKRIAASLSRRKSSEFSRTLRSGTLRSRASLALRRRTPALRIGVRLFHLPCLPASPGNSRARAP